MQPWEGKELEDSTRDIAMSCTLIAACQTSLSKAKLWLQAGIRVGTYESRNVQTYLAAITFASEPDAKFKGDEAIFSVGRNLPPGCDPTGFRSRRCLVRTLLSGSLEKNNSSTLYRSFFSSHMREVHLLPLVASYIIPIKGEGKEKETFLKRTLKHEHISNIRYLPRLLFEDTSGVQSLDIYMRCTNHLLAFLPLLYSRMPNLTALDLQGEKREKDFSLNLLPCLSHIVNPSKLEVLNIEGPFKDLSLSPLSLYNFCSLRKLRVVVNGHTKLLYGPRSLDGLNRNNTKSLKKLQIYSHQLEDISALSHCDLSSLEELSFSFCHPLSDLSPLRGVDLSSLTFLCLRNTSVSDISPLAQCIGLAPEHISLFCTPITDLSPLSRINLSRLKGRIDLCNSNVSDLSPLELIDHNLEIGMSGSVAAKEAGNEKERPAAVTIGKVKVHFC